MLYEILEGDGRMTSRIFSINLDDVTFAKLGELQKKYPDLSRNGMIRHIIHTVHLLDDPKKLDAMKRWHVRSQQLIDFLDPDGDRREIWYKQSDRRNKK